MVVVCKKDTGVVVGLFQSCSLYVLGPHYTVNGSCLLQISTNSLEIYTLLHYFGTDI